MRLLVLLWSLGPLLWQLRTSLLRPEALVAPLLEGNPWTLANYQLVLSGDPPFWRYLGNSALVAATTTLLTLLLAVPCAYGLQQQRGLLRWGVGLALVGAAMFPTVLLFLALLEIARSFLHFYISRTLSLSLVYGSLGLVPVFMFWMYVIWMIVLVGLQVAVLWDALARRGLQNLMDRHPTNASA